ncbi:invasion protein [Pelistega indica]|uniref:Invasion protein n=1 Tax=Pelistega indica TaxID=1414851 RepID=V8G8X8_9BURK|nr:MULTISPECIES: SirB2 family protein [Pelistega]ETD72546.1 invasion protein [Pelistega indica]
MAEHYLTIKMIHMSCAYTSVILLLIRIFFSVSNPAILQQAWAKYLPHIIDTVLLTCAILMVMVIGPNHPFILVKIIMLCLYILCGYITLKKVHSLSGKLIGTSFVLLIFFFIVGVAKYKSPLSWWA